MDLRAPVGTGAPVFEKVLLVRLLALQNQCTCKPTISIRSKMLFQNALQLLALITTVFIYVSKFAVNG